MASGRTNRTAALVTASQRSRFGQKAALQAAGVPFPQHNVGAKKTAPKKKTKKATAKKTAKPTAKKS
jgi:hypothetical protein